MSAMYSEIAKANRKSELASALVAAQKDMPKVEPDDENPAFKRNGKPSRFVSLDHLIAVTKPVLTKHGLTIVQQPAMTVGSNSIPALRTTILHTSGESLTETMPLILGKNDMQGLGAAITYARRYAWASLLGVSEQEDDDGNQASEKPAASPSAAGGTPKAPAPSSPGAAGAPAPTDAELTKYGNLLNHWKRLSPQFDVPAAKELAESKDGPWVIRATRRLQENIDREIEARKKVA